MPLRRKLPSPQSLFVFESAARTLNFTEAGKLLNITQPAVSKSISALEVHLGTRLFLRGKSGLSLTPDGDILYRAVQLSFSALEAAIDQVSNRDTRDMTLTLSVTTSFAAHWLIPQMQDFRRDFPDVTLNFLLTGAEAEGPLSTCDLGTRLEDRVGPVDHAAPFLPEWMMAVASPEYIGRNGTLDAPTADGAHSIITLENARVPWSDFLSATSQDLDPDIPELRVPDYSVVLQSALIGRGVALGFVSSCSYLMREGLLLPVLAGTWNTGKHYCIVTNRSSPNLQIAEDVAEWIHKRSSDILQDITPMFDPYHVVYGANRNAPANVVSKP